jgi:transposase-like protein
MTDPAVHALVKDTDRDKDKDIPQLRCQCCRKRFSSRKGTPLYHLKKKTKDVEMVMFFMAIGVTDHRWTVKEILRTPLPPSPLAA